MYNLGYIAIVLRSNLIDFHQILNCAHDPIDFKNICNQMNDFNKGLALCDKWILDLEQSCRALEENSFQ